jgi:hypothetical protein
MTPASFRKLALAMPDATEGAHGGHADFRAGGKVFASLGYPDAAWAVVKLAPEQQEMLVASTPEIFVPVKGTWGLHGNTQLRLAAADTATAKSALTMAWQGVTAKKKSPPPRKRGEGGARRA